MLESHTTSSQRLRGIRARKVKLPFSSDIPRHWFADSGLASHIANGVNLLFPAGERFFIRSVKHYLDRFADDPEMTARIREFFGQEGNHAREHERFFAILEEQGYDIRGFLSAFEAFTSRFNEQILPPLLRLAVTAAAEHFTAILAERALGTDFLDHAHPVMRDLLRWHAAEEIEHKAVAFDVLQKVNPSYALRVAGLALATLLLGGWWLGATRMLLRQDGIDRAEARRQARALRATSSDPRVAADERSIMRNVFWPGIRSYLGRGFHPNDRPNEPLAAAWLARYDDEAKA